MFEMKPDFEEVSRRFEAWWKCAILDRPLVSLSFPRPESEQQPLPESRHDRLRDRWLDAEYQARRADIRMGNTIFFADSLPVVWPNLGPEIFSAYYGCPMEYGERTAWSEPILTDGWEDRLASLRLDTEGFFYRKTLEMTDAFIERGRGRFIVGYTDLHAGGDAVAALRGPEALLMDTLERPDEVRSLCERITTDFLRVYDRLHEKLAAAGMPSTTWIHALCTGKLHIPSNDFSCMISAAAFEDLFVPGIIRECRHMDRCMYHLDGPQALRYLDRLLELPEIHAIQWVPGAGQEYWLEWIDVYRRIQEKGKALMIQAVPAADLDRLFETLRPEGVWVNAVPGIDNLEEAQAVLKRFHTWTG